MQTVENAHSLKHNVLGMLTYQHPDLEKRLARKLKLAAEEAQTLFIDLKMFLYECATTPGPHSPDERIDAAWHEFILYTEDYARFCKHFAGRFLHHRPASEAELAAKTCQGGCQCESCSRPLCDDDVRKAGCDWESCDNPGCEVCTAIRTH